MGKVIFLMLFIGYFGIIFPSVADSLIITKPTELVEEEPEEITEDPFASALDNLEPEREYRCRNLDIEENSEVVRGGSVSMGLFPYVGEPPISRGKAVGCSD